MRLNQPSRSSFHSSKWIAEMFAIQTIKSIKKCYLKNKKKPPEMFEKGNASVNFVQIDEVKQIDRFARIELIVIFILNVNCKLCI